MVYPKNPAKTPHVAWWCLVWPGSSQIIHGQVAKGVLMMIGSLIVNIVCWPVNLLVIPASIIDAYKVGNRLASGKPVRKWDWFPV